MNLRWIFLAAVTLLAACSAPTVPDFTWYRLPRAQPLEPATVPLFRDPIVVAAFGADGLYGDQPLIYALDPDAQQLRQYHYQLWTDPPTRMLQRRLILQLREAHASAEVTDEWPASQPAIRIGGTLLRFDRVPAAAGGFTVFVALKLRADRRDGAPLIDDYYHAEIAVGGAGLKATVDAYGTALDTIFAQFYGELRKTEQTHMLGEANLRRLAEMGIDVYVPRVAAARTAMAAPAAVADPMRVVALPASTQPALRANADAAAAETSSASVAVVLLADAASASANALVADVLRTLRFARIGCAHASVHDDPALAAASALVMFGDRHVRAVGALLPAQRQREIGWVVSAELAVFARDSSAKRGLWSELKRMMRELAARTDPA